MGNPGWLEPEEGWNPGWKPGTFALDKRSDLLVEIIDSQCETFDEGYDYDGSPTDRRYWSFRIRLLDGTDPMNGVWRAPEDLEPLNAMEVLAYASLP